MTNSELLQSLGWKDAGFWNNRRFLRLNSQFVCIHLNDGACYYAGRNGINYRKKLSENDIREYTKIIKHIAEIRENLKKYTAYDYVEACKALATFVRNISKN